MKRLLDHQIQTRAELAAVALGFSGLVLLVCGLIARFY